MVVGIDPDAVPPLDEESAPAAVNALLTQGDVFGRSEPVPADPRRRHLRPAEMVARLGRGAELAGHLYYSFNIGPSVRAIVLDTVDRTGGSQGVLTEAELAWLRRELAAAGNLWIVVFAHNALPEPALALLDATPRVAAVIRGNSHRNTIAPRDGYWLISTSSLADFPQQARMFRLREAPGGAVLETWMVDHDGRGLAGVSRELAYLDAQGGRPQGFAGRASDRNMRLFVQP